MMLDRKFSVLFIFAMIVIAIADLPASACTTFCLMNKGEVLFGKNYDWMVGDGMIYVNRRGLSKMSAEEQEPAIWSSRYGSITFNQYGWEAPSGGMNEEGLVIELMWLDETRYPADAGRPTVDVLEWIQFNLDTAATTAEVIKASERLRINSRVTLHYLVNDRHGKAATIEFLDGKLVTHTGAKLPVAALTNDTYAKSLQFFRMAGPRSTRSVSSLDRFARAASRTAAYGERGLDEKGSIAYAFETLADAAQPNYTQWSIVYDQVRGKIHYRTLKSPAIKTINMKSFDFSCSSRTLAMDIDHAPGGDVSERFVPHTRQMNRSLIERSFNGTEFLRGVPTATRDSIATFPERFTCSGVLPPTERKAEAKPAVPELIGLVFPLYYVYKQFAA